MPRTYTHKVWNDQEHKELRRHCLDRTPLEQMCQQMSRTAKSLREKAREMGLSLSPKQNRRAY